MMFLRCHSRSGPVVLAQCPQRRHNPQAMSKWQTHLPTQLVYLRTELHPHAVCPVFPPFQTHFSFFMFSISVGNARICQVLTFSVVPYFVVPWAHACRHRYRGACTPGRKARKTLNVPCTAVPTTIARVDLVGWSWRQDANMCREKYPEKYPV